MSQVKRDLEEHEDLLMAIEALGIEEKALVRDEDTDEVSSAGGRTGEQGLLCKSIQRMG